MRTKLAAHEPYISPRAVAFGWMKRLPGSPPTQCVDKSQEMVYEEVEGGWSFEKQLEDDGVTVRASTKNGVDGILDAIMQMERTATDP